MRVIMALSEPIGGRGSQNKQWPFIGQFSRGGCVREDRGLTRVDSEDNVGRGEMRYRKREKINKNSGSFIRQHVKLICIIS
jgi:hypothetical protein